MFRHILTVFIASLMTLAQVARAKAQQPATKTLIVPKGTWLKLANIHPLDATTAKMGDDVSLRLIRPLSVDGVLLLAKGDAVHGTVTAVKRPGPHCAQGEIKWKLDSIGFADGSKAKTKVTFKSPSVNDSFEPRPSPPLSAGDKVGLACQDIMLSPVIAVAAVTIGTKWVATAPIRGKSCSKYTRDFPLPARATVVIEVVENHAVQY